jgi:hypothetical protein
MFEELFAQEKLWAPPELCGQHPPPPTKGYSTTPEPDMLILHKAKIILLFHSINFTSAFTNV